MSGRNQRTGPVGSPNWETESRIGPGEGPKLSLEMLSASDVQM